VKLCIACTTCRISENRLVLQQVRFYTKDDICTCRQGSNSLYAVSQSATPRHRRGFGRAGLDTRRGIGLARLGQLFADFVAALPYKYLRPPSAATASATPLSTPISPQHTPPYVKMAEAKVDKSFMGMPVSQHLSLPASWPV
jgi:hypothetical protein